MDLYGRHFPSPEHLAGMAKVERRPSAQKGRVLHRCTTGPLTR
jgi:hypothetical protein